MKNKNDETELDRRGFLTCMAWVGTGAVWTMTGGILKGMPIEQAVRAEAGSGGLRFVQISDSHIGFNKDANPDVTATLRAAIAKIHALPQRVVVSEAIRLGLGAERSHSSGHAEGRRKRDVPTRRCPRRFRSRYLAPRRPLGR